jgi:hypothetical protein
MANIQKSPQPFGKLAFSPKFDHLLFTTPMNTLFCLYNPACGLQDISVVINQGTKFIITLFNVFRQNAQTSQFYFLISHIMT